MSCGWGALPLLGSMVDNLKNMARVRLLVRAPSAVLCRKRSSASRLYTILLTVAPYLVERLDL